MKVLHLLFFSFLLLSVSAQTETTQPLIQPTVMVIPFAKEGEQMRTVYERDDMLNLRIAVTKMKEAFDAAGIPTIDFRAKIKQVRMDENLMAGNQSTIKQRVIELSGADVYVEVETASSIDEDGTSVTVTATAYDAFSGIVLASEVGTTKKYYTSNDEKLTQRAIGIFIKQFTNTIQEKFNDIVAEGRTIVVQIGFDENAEVDMDTELEDGSLLSDLIEEWFELNAFQGVFHIQGITASSMILDEVKIPARDKNGRTYRVSRFAAKLRNFLKKQNLEVTRDVVGTKIFLTIN